MFQKYKKIIYVVIGIILLFVVYAVFFKKEQQPLLGTTSSNIQGLSQENNELISLLSELRSITLSKDIFSSPVFLSLYDFSVILIPEPVSRPNPFAPIGSDGVMPVVQNQTDIDPELGF